MLWQTELAACPFGEGLGLTRTSTATTPAGALPLAQPHLVLDSPQDIVHTTRASVLSFSRASTHRTVQGSAYDTAGATASQVSGGATSVVALTGGIDLVAAQGAISVQAHTDQLEWLAKDQFSVTSVNGVIEITAPNQITLLAGDSGIEMNGANVSLKTPGTVSWKAASKNAGGALSGGTSLPTLPVGVVGEIGLEKASFESETTETIPSMKPQFDEQVRAVSKSDGEPVSNLPFTAETSSGKKYSGVTNKEGKIPRIHTATAESIKVSFANSDAPQIEPQFGDAGGC